MVYELALVFLLFQDLSSARVMMTYIDPNLGVPLPEKSYAEDCALTVTNLWVRCSSRRYWVLLKPRYQNAIDIFCLAHALGWFGKAMILRDYWFCWVGTISLEADWYSQNAASQQILSIAFEFAEYSLQHQLPNFAEVGQAYPTTPLSLSTNTFHIVLVGSCEHFHR